MRADRDPRAHDPAHIGKPHRAIVRPQIRSKARLQGELDEQAAVDVDGALWLAGRARRVTDQDGTLAVDPDRLAGRTVVVGDQRGVVVVGMVQAVDDDRVGDRRDRHRLLDGGAYRNGSTAASTLVLGDHDLDSTVLEAGSDCGGREAREDRHGNCADPRGRVDRGCRLNAHRQNNGDAVALTDAETLERQTESADLVPQFGKRARLDRAVLVLDDDRLVCTATLDVLANTRPGEVESAATKPRCPGQARRGIEHGRPGRLPAELKPTCRLVPKPRGLSECERQHVLIGLDAKVARERRRLRLVDRFGVRDPEVLAHAGILRAGRKVGCPKRDPGPLASQGGHDKCALVMSALDWRACGDYARASNR